MPQNDRDSALKKITQQLTALPLTFIVEPALKRVWRELSGLHAKLPLETL